MRSMMIVRFRRDGTGAVSGLEYANPVARGIVFGRTGGVAARRRNPAVVGYCPHDPARPFPERTTR